MFEKIDLSKKIDAREYDKVVPGLRKRLGGLQRAMAKLNVPAIVVFEGLEASGKGELINDLILPLDPRGFDVYEISEPGPDESTRPFFWRFWTRTPSKGRIAIFSRSWYNRTLAEKRAGMRDNDAGPVSDISYFERELADDGFLILKFFLHISRKEQRRRFDDLESDPSTAWMISGKSWQNHKKYEKQLGMMEDLIEKTDTIFAPWNIIEANDRHFAEAKILSLTAAAFESAIAGAGTVAPQCTGKGCPAPALPGLKSSILDRVDLSKSIPDKEYDRKLEKCQAAVKRAQFKAYDKKIPAIIVFEGWDASGKGGAIKRLTQSMDPRGYTVVPVGPPNDIEKMHNYLWRFWSRFPAAGHCTIFDRSWYGRVLVERVEGFCRQDEWERAYNEINEMEGQLVDSGAVLVKFWLHVDRETQLKRFESRENDPEKQWKITEDDWRNRDKWDQYREAVDEMLYRTSTNAAPWTIVEADDKNYARIKVLKTVIDAIGDSFEGAPPS